MDLRGLKFCKLDLKGMKLSLRGTKIWSSSSKGYEKMRPKPETGSNQVSGLKND